MTTNTAGVLYASIWNNEDFLDLRSEEQWLYMMLVSCAERSNAGVVPLTVNRWARRASNSTPETIIAALDGLRRQNFVVVDMRTEEVWIRSMMRWSGIAKKPYVLRNAIRAAEAVNSPGLRHVIAEELRRIRPDARSPQEAETIAELDATVTRMLAASTSPELPGVAEVVTDMFGGHRTQRRRPAEPEPHREPPRPVPEPVERHTDAAPARPSRPSSAQRQHATILVNSHCRTVTPRNRAKLAEKAAELVAGHIADDIIITALREWMSRTGITAGLLPDLAEDALKVANGTAPPRRTGARPGSRPAERPAHEDAITSLLRQAEEMDRRAGSALIIEGAS